MRLFVGIPLATAPIAELTAIVKRLQSRADRLRWPPPESWHVTLQFLGNTRLEQCACVVERLRLLHFPPVSVELQQLSSFEHAGVFIVTVRPTPGLLSLQEQVTVATRPCGFAPEARPYQPHITLARSKGKDRGQGLHALQAKLLHQPRFTRFVAEEFVLYESFLGPGGSRYEVRERFPLDGR
jgi:2'-5' RNA ligase